MRWMSAIAAIGMLFVSNVKAADLFTPEQAPVPPPEEHGIWAAIAYSAADEKYGFFWGADKREEAMDIALKHCQRDKGDKCAVVSVFRNHRHWDDDDKTGFPYEHCGALAVGERAGKQTAPWSAKSATTRREAEDLAMKACENSGTGCEIREWVCT